MKTMVLNSPYVLLLSHISVPKTFIIFLKRKTNKMLEIVYNQIRFFFDAKFEVIEKRITCSPCKSVGFNVMSWAI